MNLPALIQRSRNAASVRKRVAIARGVDQTEKQLHLAVAQYLTLALAQPDWFTTFPLGSGGKARGGQLKAAGVKAGTPDILILKAGRAYWIELKTKRGTLSEQQRLMAVDLRNAGCEWCVCRSVEEVEERLINWGFTLRCHFGRQA